ncbi:hypothetical protein [Actinoplanes sp. NPDC049681]|uniref:hypothetical protein n=1 Tax=Actinoplanes sp. NPDC049681 TaxID=3363905 RepID=UPI0037A21CCE
MQTADRLRDHVQRLLLGRADGVDDGRRVFLQVGPITGQVLEDRFAAVCRTISRARPGRRVVA